MTQRVYTQTFGVVGAILEKDGKFLLIKEAHAGIDTGKWNQPAGWIEVGENPLDSVAREVKEETGYDFVPTKILGIYSLFRKRPDGERHALKIIFTGKIGEAQTSLAEDSSETKWFTPEEIYAMQPDVLRDLDIKQEVKDYLAGKGYPLGLLTHTSS
ncbi:MAG: NUDIX domain-containing protein [Candidatus Doudnabacteria bacterium]|nr:NUDIX domain-containing protein [Candidatus Doudnabacteria bacterium]